MQNEQGGKKSLLTKWVHRRTRQADSSHNGAGHTTREQDGRRNGTDSEAHGN